MNSRKALLYWFFGQPFAIASQVFVMIYTARNLGPEQKGVFAAAISMVSLLHVFQNFGLGHFIVREQNLETRDLETTYTTLWIGCSFVSIATLVFAPLLADLAKDVRLIPLFYVLAIGPMVMPLQMLANGLLMRNHQHHVQMALTLARSLTSVIVVYWMCENGFGAVSMAWAYVISSAAVTICAVIAKPQVLRTKFGLASRKKVWGFAGGMLGISYLLNLLPRVYEILTTRVFGVVSVGYYSQMQSLCDPFKSNIQQVMLSALFPTLAEEVRLGRNSKTVYLKILECLFGFMAPIYASIAILAFPIVEFLFGADWLLAAPLLVYICLAQMTLLFVAGSYDAFLAMGKMKVLLTIEATNFVCGIGLFFVGLQFSLNAAVMTLIFSALVNSSLYAWFIVRLLKVTPKELFLVYWKSIVVILFSILPALIVSRYFGQGKLSIVHFAAIATSAGLCSFVGAGICKHLLYGELLGAVRSAINRIRRKGK